MNNGVRVFQNIDNIRCCRIKLIRIALILKQPLQGNGLILLFSFKMLTLPLKGNDKQIYTTYNGI